MMDWLAATRTKRVGDTCNSIGTARVITTTHTVQIQIVRMIIDLSFFCGLARFTFTWRMIMCYCIGLIVWLVASEVALKDTGK